MTFPRPEEVQQRFAASIEPIVDSIRKGFMNLFGTPPSGDGSYTTYVSKLWPSRVSGDYVYFAAAFKIVQGELEDAGWVVERHSDQRDGDYITIKPRQPRR